MTQVGETTMQTKNIWFNEVSLAMQKMMWLEGMYVYSTLRRLLNSSCCFSLHSFFGFILLSWPSLIIK